MKNNQTKRLLTKKLKKFDFGYIMNIYIIIFISSVFVYSSTFYKSKIFFYKQLTWILLGTVVFMVFSLIDYRNYRKFSKLIYIFNVLLLGSVYVIGIKKLGATRWINIAGFNLQPSEFAKFFIVLTFSDLLASEYDKGVRGWKGIIKTGIHIIIPVLLIMKQPDLGTSLVFVFLYFLLIFLNGVDAGPFITLILSFISMIPVSYFFILKEYQKQRILVFLKPESDILGSGWNVIQSMIAVGSGGFLGTGILQGKQNKLNFLPESHTDFIFSVLLEETGFVGGVFVIGLYLWLLIYIINIGQKSEDSFGQLISYGIAGIIFFHVTVNIGMVIGVMPVTGLPLLLMSYGGSSYIFAFMMLGVVNSIKIYSNN